jgi:diguanylate cyclase (GGDEF)-like protein
MSDVRSPEREHACERAAEEIVELVRKTLSDTKLPAPPPWVEEIPEFAQLLDDLAALRRFIQSLCVGDLNKTLLIKGYTAGALKMLQANLRHLTWQAQAIAEGDFTQRVDFMGDFAAAFNGMVQRLALTLNALRESEERYRILATTDGLTGLCNRRQFFALACDEICRAQRYCRPLSILMIDMDDFKRINDAYGHAVGDSVLREAAEAAKNALRGGDLLGRYGGEEFVALLPETALEAALVAAERIRRAIEELRVEADGAVITASASIGVSAMEAPPDQDPGADALLETLLHHADQALYRAKGKGRNRVETLRGAARA